MHIDERIHTHTRTHARSNTHNTHTHTHTKHTHTHAHTHTHTHTIGGSSTRLDAHSTIHKHAHKRIHTYGSRACTSQRAGALRRTDGYMRTKVTERMPIGRDAHTHTHTGIDTRKATRRGRGCEGVAREGAVYGCA